MDIQYWLEFSLVLLVALILILFSQGKLPGGGRLALKCSPGFLVIIRYIGWIILLYSCYSVWLDVVLRG